MQRPLLLFFALAIAAIAACGDDDESPAPTNFLDLTIEMQDNVFVPDSRSVLTNVEIVAEIENNGSVSHTFTVDDLDIDIELGLGESDTVVFDEAGEWPFYCRFHRDQGMTGTFFAEIQAD